MFAPLPMLVKAPPTAVRVGIEGLRVEESNWWADAINSWRRARDSMIVDKGFTMSVIRLISSALELSEPEVSELGVDFCWADRWR